MIRLILIIAAVAIGYTTVRPHLTEAQAQVHTVAENFSRPTRIMVAGNQATTSQSNGGYTRLANKEYRTWTDFYPDQYNSTDAKEGK